MKTDANAPPSKELPPAIQALSFAAPGNGTRNNTSMDTKITGIPSKISGLALPARLGFLSINLPTRMLPAMITIEERSGTRV